MIATSLLTADLIKALPCWGRTLVGLNMDLFMTAGRGLPQLTDCRFPAWETGRAIGHHVNKPDEPGKRMQ